MEAMQEICIAIFLSNLQKCYVLLTIAYVFSSTKLEKRAEQLCLEAMGVGGGWRGQRAVWRDGPNNVCTYEQMNKQ
jgi:hypothetical protein